MNMVAAGVMDSTFFEIRIMAYDNPFLRNYLARLPLSTNVIREWRGEVSENFQKRRI